MCKASVILLLTYIVLFCSCEKSTCLIENDPYYPTIVNKVSPDRLNTMRLDFANRNVYLMTSLNEYGFCGYADDIIQAATPPVDSTVTGPEAIEIAKEFLVRNSDFTGIKKADKLDFRRVEMMNGFWDGNKGWHLNTADQRIDTIEMLNTSIMVNIRGKEVYYCVGNWFPDIYIPKKFNFNNAASKESLINMTVTHYGWSGPFDVVITRESIQNSSTRLYVLPIEVNNHTELHLAWCINIPQPVYFKIYVDVMTNEVIGEEPTIIF
jgi:hypothetical protein